MELTGVFGAVQSWAITWRRARVGGALCGGVVRVSEVFQSRTPHLKVGGLIPHAYTSANLDFHPLCITYSIFKGQFRSCLA